METNLSVHPLVTILIPTKNRPDSLQRLLKSVRAQDYGNLEIIVIDDGSEVALSIESDDVQIIRNETSRGACNSRNQGMAIARGKFILALDDDAEFIQSDTVRRAVELAEQSSEIGAIAFQQIMADGLPSYMQPCSSNTPSYTAFFFSYGCLIRRAAYEQIGGFNEVFNYYYEEIEFSLRLHAAGYKVVYSPDFSVNHYHDTRNRNWQNIYRFETRNMILTKLLYYPKLLLPASVLRALPRYLKLTQTSTGRDYAGIIWILREVFSLRSYVMEHRKPFSYATIFGFHRLSRSPIPLAINKPA